jgi:hypothetical protein
MKLFQKSQLKKIALLGLLFGGSLQAMEWQTAETKKNETEEKQPISMNDLPEEIASAIVGDVISSQELNKSKNAHLLALQTIKNAINHGSTIPEKSYEYLAGLLKKIIDKNPRIIIDKGVEYVINLVLPNNLFTVSEFDPVIVDVDRENDVTGRTGINNLERCKEQLHKAFIKVCDSDEKWMSLQPNTLESALFCYAICKFSAASEVAKPPLLFKADLHRIFKLYPNYVINSDDRSFLKNHPLLLCLDAKNRLEISRMISSIDIKSKKNAINQAKLNVWLKNNKNSIELGAFVAFEVTLIYLSCKAL